MIEAEKATNQLARLSLTGDSQVSNRKVKKSTGNSLHDQVACAGESSIVFVDYRDESQLSAVMSLVGRDLSEPYSSTFHFILLYVREINAALDLTRIGTFA
jgi:hypothetical protein